jgi:hypothetical protein
MTALVPFVSVRQAMRFFDAIANAGQKTDSWLLHLNPSEAVLACIGAGPWKIGRRQRVQQRAIDILDGRDLSSIRYSDEYFPLDWQKNALQGLVFECNTHHQTFKTMVEEFKNPNVGWPQVLLAKAATTKTVLKCWSLFVRDYLQLPAFPIDRHVRRWLQERDLPTSESAVLELWQGTTAVIKNVPDISAINRSIVGFGFSGNPRLESRAKNCR